MRLTLTVFSLALLFWLLAFQAYSVRADEPNDQTRQQQSNYSPGNSNNQQQPEASQQQAQAPTQQEAQAAAQQQTQISQQQTQASQQKPKATHKKKRYSRHHHRYRHYARRLRQTILLWPLLLPLLLLRTWIIHQHPVLLTRHSIGAIGAEIHSMLRF